MRRGDYLEHPEMYGVSCTTEYYRAGVRYIRERHPDAQFFVFTNDPAWTEQWVQENFTGNFTLIRIRISWSLLRNRGSEIGNAGIFIRKE